MIEIICPQCGRPSQKLIFYCPRCSQKLLKNYETEGPQIILHFEGDVSWPVAVFKQNKPLHINSIDILGPTIWLQLEDSPIEEKTIHLFEVLRKEEQSWEIA